MRPVTFFKTFINSLSNAKYYIDVVNVRLRFTLRFLFVSYVALTLLATGVFLVADLPIIEKTLVTYLQQESERFPNELRLGWDGQQLSANSAETYTLPFPKFPDNNTTPPMLLQINPNVKNMSEINQLSTGQSIFFVGATEFFLARPGGGWSTYQLSDLLSPQAVTITREVLTQNIDNATGILREAVRLLPLAFPFFYFFLVFPARFIGVLMDSIIIFFCIKLLGFPMTFKKSLQISLHIMVVAEFLTILTASTAPQFSTFTVAFWTYTAIVYWNLRHIHAQPIAVIVDQDKDPG